MLDNQYFPSDVTTYQLSINRINHCYFVAQSYQRSPRLFRPRLDVKFNHGSAVFRRGRYSFFVITL
jgi:hypothetical protein